MGPKDPKMLAWFEYEHLPERLQRVSKPFHDLAYQMLEECNGEELFAGLRKLIEAKDCFVRAALYADDPQSMLNKVGKKLEALVKEEKT